APRRIARARRAPHRYRADVRSSGVLCHARHHGEIPQPLHEHAASGVGALYRRVPVPIHRVQSVDAPGPDAYQTAAATARALNAAVGLHALQFCRLRYLQLDEAIALIFSTPFFVAALSGPILGEWVHWRRWTAIAVGFVGVLVVTRPGAGSFHPAALLSLS